MSAFNLSLPTQEEVRQQVESELNPTPQESQALLSAAEEQAKNVMSIDLDSFEQRREYVQVVETFGQDVVDDCNRKNAILQKRMGSFSADGGESGEVARGLEELTLRMKDLDPTGVDFSKAGPLGKIFSPIRRYFEKFKTADEEISAIVNSLDKGRKALVDDNTTLELEEDSMRSATRTLQQNIEMGTELDAALAAAVEEAQTDGTDPEKIQFVTEEILYPLRQRITDFQQLLAVNQQGIIAMEIIRRNNRELIRSVDRAKTVTVSALRTAVTVAGALYNQKIVLEKVNALNDATNDMISSTSRMLREQGTAIHKQAAEASVSVDTLKQAFADTFQALDDISAYKQEALPRMQASIEEFQELAAEGEKQIRRMERGQSFTGEH